MYNEMTRKISYILIVAGVLLLGLGLWQYMPREFSSETPNSVFMSITAKRVVFPILGLALTAVGVAFLKFLDEVEEDIQLLRSEFRNELSRLTEMMEKKNDN